MKRATSYLLLCLAGALVPANGLFQVDGSGTTNPSKFFWKIMETIEARTKSDVRLTYRAVGSGTGQKEFSQVTEGDYSSGLSDFGSGDIPMSQAHYSAIDNAGREMVHVPFSLGAIAVFHSVPRDEVGSSGGLHLSPCVLAKIFSGQITTWDHAEITALNPNLAVPAGTQIKVGHRTRGSSSTGGITGYLQAKVQADCPAAWNLGAGSTITWPTSSGFTAVEGSGGMTAHIADTAYALGYLDAGHGHDRNFQEVRLQNEAGNWLTSMDALNANGGGSNNGVAAAGAAAVADGVIPASVTADWSDVNLYRKGGAVTWPIVLVSYIYLNKDMSSLPVEKVALIKAFVDYVTGSQGQGMLPDFSFNAIPEAMNTWSNTWNVIVKPVGWTAASAYVFYTSTEPWVGMGDKVITSKRDTWSLWKLNSIDVAVSAMQDRIEALETHLDGYGIVPLHGSGTTNLKSWFAKAMRQMETRARVPLLLTYRAVGSGTGQKEFVGNEANGWRSYSDFGAGDIPMSSSNFATLMTRSPAQNMVHIPLALGAIAIFHSIPSGEIGSSALALDACLLAKIFSGQITTWDHAEILAQNPGLQVPAGQAIRVGVRTLGSSSTGGFSGYLNAKCPGSWTLGAGSTIDWPDVSTIHSVQGSPGMLANLRENDYAIGYLDAGHGHDFNLAEVALTNRDGQTRTSREAIRLGGVADAGTAGVTESVFPTDASLDWSDVNLYDKSGVNTWPIVLVSYLYVKRDQSATNPKTAAALQAFIDMVVRDREGLAQEFGFTSPSTELRALSLSAANDIQYPAGMVSFTFETDTDAYSGMGVNVISKKRHSFDLYDSGVVRDSIRSLETDMEARLGSRPSSSSDDDDSRPMAPLVISIVALVISLCSACAGCLAVRAAKSRPARFNSEEGEVIGAPRM